MPELLGLLGDRLDQMRMGVAERVDRHARGEIEIALAVGRDQPSALAPLEGEVDARIGRQQMRCRERCSATPGRSVRNEMCRLSGRHGAGILLRRRSAVNTTGAPGWRLARAGAATARQADKCGCRARQWMNMWTQVPRTLAPDSRHIVAFRSSDTTSRAADSSLSTSWWRQCVGANSVGAPATRSDSVRTSPRRLARD